MQFANLYPSKRSTIICLYSGAFCASAVIFVVLKYLYDFGLSYFVVTLILTLTSLLMFPFTLLILPSDRIREESDEVKQPNEKSDSMFKRNAFRSSLSLIRSKVTLEKFTLLSSPYFTRKSSDFEKQSENTINGYKTDLKVNNQNPIYAINPIFWAKEQIPTPSMIVSTVNTSTKSIPPLKISLWSWAFNLHQWWFSWMITYMVMYVGSLNLWLQRVTDNNQIASDFSQIYGCAQVFCLFLAPIAGLLMDYSIKKAEKETDPFQRKLKRVRAGFWTLFVTTLFLTACLICRFFDNQTAIYTSIVFMTIFRAFLVAVGTAFLRIRY